MLPDSTSHAIRVGELRRRQQEQDPTLPRIRSRGYKPGHWSDTQAHAWIQYRDTFWIDLQVDASSGAGPLFEDVLGRTTALIDRAFPALSSPRQVGRDRRGEL